MFCSGYLIRRRDLRQVDLSEIQDHRNSHGREKDYWCDKRGEISGILYTFYGTQCLKLFSRLRLRLEYHSLRERKLKIDDLADYRSVVKSS